MCQILGVCMSNTFIMPSHLNGSLSIQLYAQNSPSVLKKYCCEFSFTVENSDVILCLFKKYLPCQDAFYFLLGI